jgi:hypothetical protein
LDLTIYGNDLFYRYINSAGVEDNPVNISQIYSLYPSFSGTCLVDGSNDVHFLWLCGGISAVGNSYVVSYKKMTAGVLGARTDLTTLAGASMRAPTMDIDVNGDIHVMWYNRTTDQSIEYRKFSGGVWGAVEVVDTAAYVGILSNIIVDKNCDVHITYGTWADVSEIKDILYRKRTSGVWSAATNLSPGKATAGYNQFPGQCYLDNKGNVLITWSGKGYGAHTTVYHPVYRYITPAGTVVPAVGVDAVDMFPDDDHGIFYPTVFWHSYPLIDSVYSNLAVSGLTFMYLYDPHGASDEIVDLKFYSSEDALVGDSGSIGIGGSGSSDITPGGVSGESLLQQDVYTIGQRGYIGKSNTLTSTKGGYFC